MEITLLGVLDKDNRIPLISATGSTRMGKVVAKTVGAVGEITFGIGGNNAIIGADTDIKMTVIGAVFGAVGTAGQRCTSQGALSSTNLYMIRLNLPVDAYGQLHIGNPLDENNHVGH